MHTQNGHDNALTPTHTHTHTQTHKDIRLKEKPIQFIRKREEKKGNHCSSGFRSQAALSFQLCAHKGEYSYRPNVRLHTPPYWHLKITTISLCVAAFSFLPPHKIKWQNKWNMQSSVAPIWPPGEGEIAYLCEKMKLWDSLFQVSLPSFSAVSGHRCVCVCVCASLYAGGCVGDLCLPISQVYY